MRGCVDHGYKGNRRGYSQVVVSGRAEYRHRVAYAASVNLPVTALVGVVRHSCDNPRCINPRHLKLGTHQDNSDDMMARGRHWVPTGEQSPHAALNREQVEVIKMRYKPRCRSNGARALSREFKVSDTTVRDVLKGRTWGVLA